MDSDSEDGWEGNQEEGKRASARLRPSDPEWGVVSLRHQCFRWRHLEENQVLMQEPADSRVLAIRDLSIDPNARPRKGSRKVRILTHNIGLPSAAFHP